MPPDDGQRRGRRRTPAASPHFSGTGTLLVPFLPQIRVGMTPIARIGSGADGRSQEMPSSGDTATSPRAYWCATAALADRHVDAAAAQLSAAEQERGARFVHWHDRRDYAMAHALVRLALGARLGRDPRSLVFTADERGKPHLVIEPGDPPPAFSLTHCRGLVACVVADAGLAGIDAEPAARPVDMLDIARRFFAASEVERLERREDDQRGTLFYELWTLKEALFKALGVGLGAPLNSASFEVADGAVRLDLSPPLTDEGWSCYVTAVAGTHTLAVVTSAAANAGGPLVVEEAAGEAIASGQLR